MDFAHKGTKGVTKPVMKAAQQPVMKAAQGPVMKAAPGPVMKAAPGPQMWPAKPSRVGLSTVDKPGRPGDATLKAQLQADARYEYLASKIAYDVNNGARKMDDAVEIPNGPTYLLTWHSANRKAQFYQCLSNPRLPPVLVFVGTEVEDVPRATRDIAADTDPCGVGLTMFLEMEQELVPFVNGVGDRFVIAGHSLGGSLAQLATLAFGGKAIKTVLFNSPGVHPRIADQYRKLRAQGKPVAPISDYVVGADNVDENDSELVRRIKCASSGDVVSMADAHMSEEQIVLKNPAIKKGAIAPVGAHLALPLNTPGTQGHVVKADDRRMDVLGGVRALAGNLLKSANPMNLVGGKQRRDALLRSHRDLHKGRSPLGI